MQCFEALPLTDSSTLSYPAFQLTHPASLAGTAAQVPPAAGAPASCVAVTFDSFTARLGGLPEARLSLAWLSPLGYVDTLYLDEDTRVSVGDKGGLFVLRRVAGEAAGAAGGEAQW